MPKPKAARAAPAEQDRVSLRIDLAGGKRIGPGKIAVLEAIERSGSISAAGRALGMSYRRTWALVEDLNTCLAQPMVEAAVGGAGGGGALLTDTGRAVVACYRTIEAESTVLTRRQLAKLRGDDV